MKKSRPKGGGEALSICVSDIDISGRATVGSGRNLLEHHINLRKHENFALMRMRTGKNSLTDVPVYGPSIKYSHGAM